jgi:hypothetical protein
MTLSKAGKAVKSIITCNLRPLQKQPSTVAASRQSAANPLPFEIEWFGFLPKAATLLLQRFWVSDGITYLLA